MIPEFLQNFFSVSELLDISYKQLTPEDLLLSAAILETRSIPQARINNTPLLFSIGTTLELAQLPLEAKPKQPGKSATEICRQQINYIPYQMDTKEFITAIVEEIANDSLSQMINKNDF